MEYPYIITENTLTIMVEGRARSIHSDHKYFSQIKEAIKEKDFVKTVDLLDVAEQVNVFGQGKISVVNGVVYYDGQVIDNTLATKILAMKDDGFDINPMVNFLENLMDNPSYRAIQELYLFMEFGNLPITPDGHFLAYKKVDDNFKDYHTGKFDNSPGKIVEMPRNQVDDNRDNTCSNGLHFCSLSYLQHYYGNQGKVIILKINPRDVVSIPSDYNNTKGRACRYEVVSEYTGPETEHAFNTSVVDFNDNEDVNDDNSWGDSWGDTEDSWPDSDPYGNSNESDSWEDTSYAQEGFELETNDKASTVSELDDADIESLKGADTNAHLDGGTFTYNGKTPDGSHLKPEHPDQDRDGVPKAVKALINQIRVRDGRHYLVQAVAGPIRDTKGRYTGKWALHIKDVTTGVDGVLEMSTILKDKLISGDVVVPNIMQDILHLNKEYKKNMDSQKDE